MFKFKEKKQCKNLINQLKIENNYTLVTKEIQKLNLKNKYIIKNSISKINNIFNTVKDNLDIDTVSNFTNLYTSLNIPREIIVQKCYAPFLIETLLIMLEDKRFDKNEIEKYNSLITILDLHECVDFNYDPHTKKLIDTYTLLSEIENGIMPVITNSIISLKKNEIHYICIDNVSLQEMKTVRNYGGGSSGFSFRVARGISYRVGSHKGTITSTEELKLIDTGKLNITNQRIIFNGISKSLVSEFNKIIDMKLFSNGIQITVSNRQRASTYIMKDYNVDLVALLISKIQNQ